jgi:Holliday junction resolvase RusA-like endonuclease
MKIELSLLGIKSLSLNSAYKTDFKTRRRCKTPGFYRLESKVNYELRKYRSELSKFNKYFDKEKHYICAEYRFYMPIFTKSGVRINEKSGDVSNLIKIIEDLVFKQLLTDDSYIVDLYATKINSDKVRTDVTLSIKDLKHIT